MVYLNKKNNAQTTSHSNNCRPSSLILCSIILLSFFCALSIFIYDNDVLQKNTSGYIHSVENSIITSTKDLHSNKLDEFMKFFTDFGRNFFWPLMIIILFIFGRREGRITALVLVISFIVVIPLNTVIKDLINRDRPSTIISDQYIEETKDSSYPSGHASLVTVGATSVFLFYKGTTQRKIISSLLIFEASLVCFSRIYLGVHFPTDVLGGILLGMGITLAVSSIHRKLKIIVDYIKWRN